MSCGRCNCRDCQKENIKAELISSMAFELRNQTQAATTEWFLNRLVDLEYRLRETEFYGCKTQVVSHAN